MNDRRQSLKSWAAGIRGSAVVRSGSTAGVIKGVGLVMAFLLQMLLARLVADPAQYGAYAWGQSMLFLLGSLFALGIPLATSRLVAIHASHGDHVSLAGVRRSGMRWLALSALTGATLAAILVVSLPASAFEELSRPIALVAAFASPLATFMLFHQAMARAQSHLVFAFLPTQVLRPLLAGLLAVAWFLWIQSRPGGIEILLAVCASLALVLAIQMSVVYRHRPNAKGRTSPQTGSTAREQRYGSERIMPVALPIFATRLFDLLAQYGNVFILGMLAGPLAAAGFFVAERLSRLASVPQSVIGSVIQPWLASAHADGDDQRLQQVVTHAAHATLWPTLAITALVLALGQFLLGLFGVEYRSALPILAVLVTSHVIGAALGPTTQVLMMSGQQKAVMRVMGLVTVFHLIALAVLIPLLGALGAALASLMSTSAARIGCLRLVRRRLGLEPAVLHQLNRPGARGDSRRDAD